MNLLDIMQNFYYRHPILFEIVLLPFELFFGIAIAFFIIRIFRGI